jgi:hypothetical protein
MAKLCFSIVCTTDIEEKLIDSILISLPHDVFTSIPIFSHGMFPGKMRAIEQVTGRSGSVFVQVLVDDDESLILQSLLQRDFIGTGIRFWATPIVFDGEII